MNTTLAPESAAAVGHDTIRVMVVDDAVVVRGLLARWIDDEPDMRVVASLRGGRDAIAQLESANPDVVILDVDMPDTDGITALPRLIEKKPDLVVIMASTLTRRNAEISLRALSLGAADYIPKPETTREITTSPSFRRELVDKVRALGLRRKRPHTPPRAFRQTPVPARPTGLRAPGMLGHVGHVTSPTLAPADSDVIRLRPYPPLVPRVLLIGASTGGPQALNSFLGQIQSVIDSVPILLVQHMPPTFTTILAEHITRAAGRPAHEALDGEDIRAGQIYVAPGARHMRVVHHDGVPRIALDDGPLINFCKPSVDPLFSSAAQVWGSKTLALVLTGMGSDGCRGAADVVGAGGSVVAQDEASSVVWGMPGSVAQAGLCSAVLPLADIAQEVVRLFGGRLS
jgi:two-component system, chemotaxis family, protein-glutamate methylesterase/glutaminase